MNVLEARFKALELAVAEVPNGTTWDQALKLADRFATFVINGSTGVVMDLEDEDV